MQATLTTSEIARIEELLSRLAPDPGLGIVCPVKGCLHAHAGPALRGQVAALAA